MTLKPPPVDWDRHAQLVARSIAGLDRTRLSGGKTQFTAIIHEAIVDAMMMAAESNTPKAAVVAAVSQTSAPVEHGTTVKPGLGKPEAVLADLQDIRGAIAEFRAQRRDSYPHEVVAMLIEAFEQMADMVERVLPAHVSNGRLSSGGGENRPLDPQTQAQQRPDVAGNGRRETSAC